MTNSQQIRVVAYDTTGAQFFASTFCTMPDAIKFVQKNLKGLVNKSPQHQIGAIHFFIVDS